MTTKNQLVILDFSGSVKNLNGTAVKINELKRYAIKFIYFREKRKEKLKCQAANDSNKIPIKTCKMYFP